MKADVRAFAIVCLLVIGLAGCGKKAEKEAAEGEAPTPVLVETVVRGAVDYMVAADAILYPINQANVTPKISAPVKRMLVNRGDHVKAGQVLAELESGDLAAAASESNSQYQQAQASYQVISGATVLEDKEQGAGRRSGRATGAGCGAEAVTTIE